LKITRQSRNFAAMKVTASLSIKLLRENLVWTLAFQTNQVRVRHVSQKMGYQAYIRMAWTLAPFVRGLRVLN
jgi:hypothetical protein